MDWNEEHWDKELLRYYKQLISIRKKSEALRRGTFSWLEVKDDLIAFERKTDKETAIVIINNHEKEESFSIDREPCKVLDAFVNKTLQFENNKLVINLDKYSAKVLILQES